MSEWNEHVESAIPVGDDDLVIVILRSGTDSTGYPVKAGKFDWNIHGFGSDIIYWKRHSEKLENKDCEQ